MTEEKDQSNSRVPDDSGTNNEIAEWPVELQGITESVIATKGPDDRWSIAALGLKAGEQIIARTWGRTRTSRNFDRERSGYVQFTRDPLQFVEAALGVPEQSDPIIDSADAWVAVDVEPIDRGEKGGTAWIDWTVTPHKSAVRCRTVPTTNRGYNAVIEASVAASRLEVDTYDRQKLLDRIKYFETVVERCGSERAQKAMARLYDLTPSLENEGESK